MNTNRSLADELRALAEVPIGVSPLAKDLSTALAEIEGERWRRRSRLVLAASVVLASGMFLIGRYSAPEAGDYAHATNFAKDAAARGDLTEIALVQEHYQDLNVRLTDLSPWLQRFITTAPIGRVEQAIRHARTGATHQALTESAIYLSERLATGERFTETETFFLKYLLSATTNELPRGIRTHAANLLMRLSLENPVVTAGRVEDLAPVRTRASEILSASGSSRTLCLQAGSMLSCTGTTNEIPSLLNAYQSAEEGTEEQRLFLLALERTFRRAMDCPAVLKGDASIKSFAIRLSKLQQPAKYSDWIPRALSLRDPANREKWRDHYRGLDFVEAKNRFGYESRDAPWRELTTQSSDPTPHQGSLAAWDFSRGRFSHSGSAVAAQGRLLTPVKLEDEARGNLRFPLAEQGALRLDFDLAELPEHGIQVRVRHLAASRKYAAYHGQVRTRILLNDKELTRSMKVSTAGKSVVTFTVPSSDLEIGTNSIELRVVEGSTTAYWVYETAVTAWNG